MSETKPQRVTEEDLEDFFRRYEADPTEVEVTLRHVMAVYRRLQNAAVEHYEQKADDRCWMDDDRLYAAAGFPAVDRRVGSKEAMLLNCMRYVTLRCEGGGPWKSYAELEGENEELRATIRAAHAVLDEFGVSRGTEKDEGGGIVLITEYAVPERIRRLAESADTD